MCYFFLEKLVLVKLPLLDISLIICKKKNRLKLTEVTSPTFNLLNEYEVKDLLIQHYDLFRLENSNETQNIGLLENRKNVLTLVEWPEKIKKKPKRRIELIFEYKSKLDKRILKINDFR